MDSRTGPLIVAHATARAPPVLEPVAPPPVRALFALEVLGFCVRAHMHRMRSFLLRSRLLGMTLGALGREVGIAPVFAFLATNIFLPYTVLE